MACNTVWWSFPQSMALKTVSLPQIVLKHPFYDVRVLCNNHQCPFLLPSVLPYSMCSNKKCIPRLLASCCLTSLGNKSTSSMNFKLVANHQSRKCQSCYCPSCYQSNRMDTFSNRMDRKCDKMDNSTREVV